jgi:ferredoxin
VKKMAYKITDKCISCGSCAANCPMQCISQGDSKFEIDATKCISCGTCAGVCPVGAPCEE